jgi:hypothetical protein
MGSLDESQRISSGMRFSCRQRPLVSRSIVRERSPEMTREYLLRICLTSYDCLPSFVCITTPLFLLLVRFDESTRHETRAARKVKNHGCINTLEELIHLAKLLLNAYNNAIKSMHILQHMNASECKYRGIRSFRSSADIPAHISRT